MRPSKITPEIRARCREIAELKAKTPTYIELELETGIRRNYLAKIVHEIMQERGAVKWHKGISIAEK